MLSITRAHLLGCALFLFISGVRGADEETCSQNRDGCKIDDNRCVCGYGCYTEYRYNTKSECQKVLRAQQWDLCQNNPCRHDGSCTQISQEPGFKCRCEGTGFYGQRCQRPCPKMSSRIQGEFPFECIVV